MLKILIGKYEATIYREGRGYRGAVDVGTGADRQRLKRRGRTKEIVKDKLKKAVAELEAGIDTSDSYTVEDAVRDWLKRGTKGMSAKTINDYTSLAESNIIPFIGATKLKRLTADDVDDWLDERADHLTTRTLQAIHSIVRRSIRRAQGRDKVMRNVAALADTPEGRKDGRPSKAMNLDQATTVLAHAKDDPLHAYVVLSLMTGVRTEEARALRWSHVVAWVEETGEWRPVTEVGFKHEKFAVYVWRSVREDGDTKTEKSRRTLEIPEEVATALKEHHAVQVRQRLIAGKAWQDNDLVFCTGIGTPLDAANVRRSFRRITKAAGIGTDWTPRELRHSFVSIMSDNGVTIEQIADLVGHKTTIVTQKVYRHQLKPVISTGAIAMNTIFTKKSA
ncbi:MAG: site-specific integrase [Nocardiopsaceae bacterium]|nr:site-specific integrase [Nocardiopsaceae bacterium]